MPVSKHGYHARDMSDDPQNDPAINSVEDYHQRSKHSLQKYARGPDTLDWNAQPDPFRSYAGTVRYKLPLSARQIATPYPDLFHPGRVEAAAITLESIAALFELSMGLSSWKVYGATRWALRNNPSSGNLHPTESYIVFPGDAALPAGVYHYHVYAHSLEHRCEPEDTESFKQTFADNSFLIGLSSIHWREAWKYGERAYRYCQHDVGHAIACFRYAAATLGWQVRLLDTCSDEHITGILGLYRTSDYTDVESEAPDAILQISCGNQDANTDNTKQAEVLSDMLASGHWHGCASRLSSHHFEHWNVIEEITQYCQKPVSPIENVLPESKPILSECSTQLDASFVIRKRRSAQSFDGSSIMPLFTLYRLLDCLLPRITVPPFDVLSWQPRVHLVVFIHRVDGLKPGLYALPRSEQGEILLRKNLREQFDWSRPAICPEWLPLHHLISAKSQKAARTLSCHQNIASDSALCISMLAEFENTIKDAPWRYRQLFWEAGMIGQSLYLEAEAANISGTGIGCFFDDAVHETLGINNTALQSIYSFTVGTAIRDTRLVSLPPYSHLEELRGS